MAEEGIKINLISEETLHAMPENERVRFILDQVKQGIVCVLETGLTAKEEAELIRLTMSEINQDEFVGIEMQGISTVNVQKRGFIDRVLRRKTPRPRMSVIGPAQMLRTVYKDGNLVRAVIFTKEETEEKERTTIGEEPTAEPVQEPAEETTEHDGAGAPTEADLGEDREPVGPALAPSEGSDNQMIEDWYEPDETTETDEGLEFDIETEPEPEPVPLKDGATDPTDGFPPEDADLSHQATEEERTKDDGPSEHKHRRFTLYRKLVAGTDETAEGRREDE